MGIGISHSISYKDEQWNEYYRSLIQLKSDIDSLSKINQKRELNIFDELKIIMMYNRIKENMEIANRLTNVLSHIDCDQRIIYIQTIDIIDKAVKTIEAFNARV
jgi:hypothetical protein